MSSPADPHALSPNLINSRPDHASSPISYGTPPSVPIPNIPPRSATSSAPPRLASRSLNRPSSPKPDQGGARITPKPSNQDLIERKSPPQPGHSTSALTAQMSSTSAPLSRRESQDVLKHDSMSSTPRPDESGYASPALAEATDEDKAKVLRRHLVSAEERGARGSPIPGDVTPAGDHGDSGDSQGHVSEARRPSTIVRTIVSSMQDAEGSSGVARYGATDDGVLDDENFPIPFDAPGGDVTHDIYKWQQDHRPRPNRSASYSHVPQDRTVNLDPTLAHIKEPGGFRRNFVINRAQENGLVAPTIVRNVIDFLFLYGHFAGEDLDEDEDEDDDTEEDDRVAEAGQVSRRSVSRDIRDRSVNGSENERTSLLRAHSKTRHRRIRSGPPVGSASVTQATLMLLKGFVGTGILFMAKAFFNGGIVFSTVVMLFIAAVSLYSFLLLTKTYLVVPGSFGDIGGILYGNGMRLTILASITVSQIGFVAAYTIFIAENLQAFVLAVTDCKTFIPTRYLIFSELILFLPLAMIRNITKLSGTALVADAFILIGLIYIGVNETTVLATKGIADVALFNKDSFPLLIGTAIFAFEGIGLVIPITESMREPHKFPPVLSGVMFLVAILFAGFGILGYAAYGSAVQTVVIVNLPQNDKFVQAVQFLYSIAILLSIPLQLFPAVRIMENGIFSKSGKHNSSVKWQKNVFRATTVVFCSLLSWAGSAELDKFVALIGAFACLPLCFIYPPLLHLKACAKTRKAKAIDYALLLFGILVGIYSTVQTIRSLFQPGSGESPQLGRCETPKDY